MDGFVSVMFLMSATHKIIGKRIEHFPFYVFSETSYKNFIPSGLMGDVSCLRVKIVKIDGKRAIKLEYKPYLQQTGRQGWAGMCWQNPPNNWGNYPVGGYDLSLAKFLVFTAKGKRGGERVLFKVGGIGGKYGDSCEKGIKTTLSKDWKEYYIDLRKADKSYIIGGFSVIFKERDNLEGAEIYLRDIYYTDEDIRAIKKSGGKH